MPGSLRLRFLFDAYNATYVSSYFRGIPKQFELSLLRMLW
jgi:hypothetical protein